MVVSAAYLAPARSGRWKKGWDTAMSEKFWLGRRREDVNGVSHHFYSLCKSSLFYIYVYSITCSHYVHIVTTLLHNLFKLHFIHSAITAHLSIYFSLFSPVYFSCSSILCLIRFCFSVIVMYGTIKSLNYSNALDLSKMQQSTAITYLIVRTAFPVSSVVLWWCDRPALLFYEMMLPKRISPC